MNRPLAIEQLEPRRLLAAPVAPPVQDPPLTITFSNTETVSYEGEEVPSGFSFPGSVGPVNVVVNELGPASDYTVNEDEVLVVNAADGVSGGLPGAELVAGPTYGDLMLDDDGSFIYAPHHNFYGLDHFLYRLGDVTFLVTLSVANVNDSPATENDSFHTREDEALVTSSVLVNDYDVDGDLLSIESFTQPPNGEVAHNGNGIFTYTPDVDWWGTDEFTYVATDGWGGTGEATVTIVVEAVNDSPVAVSDTYSVRVDGPLSADSDAGLCANDYDPDGDELAGVRVTAQPAHGRLTVIEASGAFLYIPDPEYTGPDSFKYKVSDRELWSDPATVTITVVDSNLPIVRSDVYLSGPGGITIDAAMGVLANDMPVGGAGVELVATLVTAPSHGLLALNADGSFTYTPPDGYVGADPFTYRATDGELFGEVQSAIWVEASTATSDMSPPREIGPVLSGFAPLSTGLGGGSIYDTVAFSRNLNRSNWAPILLPQYVDPYYAS